MKLRWNTLASFILGGLACAACLLVCFCLMQFFDGQRFHIFPLDTLLFPQGFVWNKVYRGYVLWRLLFLQIYVLIFGGLISFLILKRFMPGLTYLLVFVYGWIFEAFKAPFFVYGDRLYLSNMEVITYLSCFGQFVRMAALLFFVLQNTGFLMQQNNYWYTALFIVFAVLFSFLQVDVTTIFPSGLLNVANSELLTGFSALCFAFGLLCCAFTAFSGKAKYRTSNIFFVQMLLLFLASNILFFCWHKWVLLGSLGFLYGVTGKILFDQYWQSRWRLD